MPPKRKAAGKAAAGKAAAAKSKKAKQEEVDEQPATNILKDQITKLMEADKGKAKKYKPDTFCPFSQSSEVHEDFDAMLNRINVFINSNKFYIIQVLKFSGKFYTWSRWGRVGKPGQSSTNGPFNEPTPAIKDFEKKFKDKTRNNWNERSNFTQVEEMYTFLDMAEDEDDGIDQVDTDITIDPNKKEAACSLDTETQNLMKLIFDNDIFQTVLKYSDIDTKKMPLEKLSKTKIAKGFTILEQLEEAIKKNKISLMVDLSSIFYTVIPTSFERIVPTPIVTKWNLQSNYDMLALLGDVEMVQSIQKDRKKVLANTKSKTVPHSLDINYVLLNCKMKLLDKKSSEYKIIEQYYMATKGNYSCMMKISDIWEMDRSGESSLFAANKGINHRKLLWHGAKMTRVAAALKSGLHRVSHHPGRVGRGIYFASVYDKSARYNEKNDTVLKLDGKNVIVPQGKPKEIPQYASSRFKHSKYIVYREDQVRMRYLLLFDM